MSVKVAERTGQRRKFLWGPGEIEWATAQPAVAGAPALESLAELLECGGKGGKPGPCPQGGTAGAPHEYKPRANDSPALQKWLAGSKVVDESGAPLTVYHGTNADFNAFDLKFARKADIKGAYFATDEKLSGAFGAKNTIAAHVNLKNPASFEDVAALAKSGVKTDKLHSALKKQGFDGIYDPKRQLVIAFDPKQIKSADKNKGTFDPKSANIYESASLEAALENLESGQALLECGGEGGKPGPCPEGGGEKAKPRPGFASSNDVHFAHPPGKVDQLKITAEGQPVWLWQKLSHGQKYYSFDGGSEWSKSKTEAYKNAKSANKLLDGSKPIRRFAESSGAAMESVAPTAQQLTEALWTAYP